MSTADPRAPTPDNAPRHGFWVKELPFSVVLILTVAGVAYTSFSKNPITLYWEILAPLIGLVCIAYGWPNANDRAARIRLIATQGLHWFAFLLVINMMLLTSVQRVFTSGATGLAIFTLLALGTFTAGVHVLSWQVCLLGLIMALGIPVIAWIENSVLILVLILAVAVALAVVVWWRWHRRRATSPLGA
jgi:hypothetical protein